jgi:hypothetical protein
MAITIANPSIKPTASSVETLDRCGADRRSAGTKEIDWPTLIRSSSARARHALIAEAAYQRFQQRGFAAGDDLRDWFEAEREVDAILDPDL